MKIKVAVVGATGYTGLELIRILINHPEVDLTVLTSQKYAGMKIDNIFPSLKNKISLLCERLESNEVSKKADIIFTALPHKTAMETIPHFYREGKRVIDLSADFRFKDPKIYEMWYQKHSSPELLRESVYGLPELNRERISKAMLVGNPGCYPTGALIGLIPLVKSGFINLDKIIIDSKSGVSGAGRDVVVESLFCEVNEGVKAYKIFSHRHTPEIEQELSEIAGESVKITFVPHLVPMDRGILTTIYLELKKEMKQDDVLDLYQEFYRNEPFVRIYPKGMFPNTKDVRGSNFCDVGIMVNDKDGRLVVVTAIDNLIKGASGEAVQNMNIMLGFPETMGLDSIPLFP